MRLAETRAQVLLENLAHCVPGKRIDEFQLLGALLDGETLLAAVLTDIVELHLASLLEHYNSYDPLSRSLVWQSEYGRICDSRMTVKHFFDLDDGNVLCVADNDVLEAARDPDVSGTIDRAKVASVEPSIGIERSVVEPRIHVAGEALGTSKQ